MYRQSALADAGPVGRPPAFQAPKKLIGLAVDLARQGYGEAVVQLALSRKGLPRDAAHLIASSVVACQAATSGVHAGVIAAPAALTAPRTARMTSEQRASRAAALLLSRLVSFVMFFLVFFVAGLGGGALLGWEAGFGSGVEDGARWALAALIQLAAY